MAATQAAAAPIAVPGSIPRGPAGLAGVALAGAFVAVPASFIFLAVARGGDLVIVPEQHFLIVSAVSLLAALMAAILAVTTIQLGLYRVLLLCLGYVAMGAIFAVHGLTTPGILVPRTFFSAVVTSAYLSLAVPGVFFAATYAPGIAWVERRLPF